MKLIEIENAPRWSSMNVVAARETTPDSLGSLIMRTKLYRPPVGADLVCRDRLLMLLSDRRERLLTVIQASAGYGKSILASSYAAGLDEPNAWISLDDGDNDLRRFLLHFIAAVRSMFEESCSSTVELLMAPALPPLDVVTQQVINDLDGLGGRSTLFLDDYHHIQGPAVHEFFKALFKHPPRGLHIVMTTRTTPPLAVNALRAKGELNEITENSLRFTLEETTLFLQRAAAVTPDAQVLEWIDEKIEGWAAGLRLLALAVQNEGDLPVLLDRLHGDATHIAEFLAAEVAAGQSPAFEQCLLHASLPDRFCASLCEALHDRTDTDTAARRRGEVKGRDFIAYLKTSGMFLVPLDRENRWFRFHYMVRQLLKKQLEERVGPREIQRLHSLAGQWFVEHRLFVEGIRHMLLGGELESAVRVIEIHRNDVLVKGEWYSLKEWLEQIPEATIAVKPNLLMARAWVLFHQFRLVEILPILEVVEALLKKVEPDAHSPLRGELDFFRGFFLNFSNRSKESLPYFENARRRIPHAHEHAWGENELHFGLARQMSGSTAVSSEYRQILRESSAAGDMFRSRIGAGLIYVPLLEGAPQRALPLVEELDGVADRLNGMYERLWSTYLRGNIGLVTNDLSSAVKCFSFIREHRYQLFTRTAADAVAGLAVAYQLSGRPDQADETLALLSAFIGQTETQAKGILFDSCRARLAVLRGDVSSVTDWADTVDISADVVYMIFFVESPRLTQCRVWIAARTASSLCRAEEALEKHLALCKKTHNNYQAIQILTLQSSVYFELGDQVRARAAFAEAVRLGAPGGVILPFVEMGRRALELLPSLKVVSSIAGWCDDVQAAIRAWLSRATRPHSATLDRAALKPLNDEAAAPSKTASLQEDRERNCVRPGKDRSSIPPTFHYSESSVDPSDEPLTAREMQILSLLADGLRNKEIANRLFVSCETVKKHLYNMYQKFDVHSRGGLVAKFLEGDFRGARPTSD